MGKIFPIIIVWTRVYLPLVVLKAHYIILEKTTLQVFASKCPETNGNPFCLQWKRFFLNCKYKNNHTHPFYSKHFNYLDKDREREKKKDPPKRLNNVLEEYVRNFRSS